MPSRGTAQNRRIFVCYAPECRKGIPKAPKCYPNDNKSMKNLLSSTLATLGMPGETREYQMGAPGLIWGVPEPIRDAKEQEQHGNLTGNSPRWKNKAGTPPCFPMRAGTRIQKPPGSVGKLVAGAFPLARWRTWHCVPLSIYREREGEGCVNTPRTCHTNITHLVLAEHSCISFPLSNPLRTDLRGAACTKPKEVRIHQVRTPKKNPEAPPMASCASAIACTLRQTPTGSNRRLGESENPAVVENPLTSKLSPWDKACMKRMATLGRV